MASNGLKSIAYIENLSLEDSELTELCEQAMDWSHTHGFVLRPDEYKDRSDYAQFCPMTLFPSPFPRQLFEEAANVQKLSSELYFKVAYDFEFLLESLAPVIETDEFTRKMVDIYKTVHKEGIRQKFSLLLQRADYMPHMEGDQLQLKQIEVNNIAALPALAERATKLHRYMLNKVGLGDKATLAKHLPENLPAKSFAMAVYGAWKCFGDPEAIVLVVMTKVCHFQYDFRHVEYEIDELSIGQCKSIFLVLSDCVDRLSLSHDNSLLLDGRNGKKKVSVVYFHSYLDGSSLTERDWDLRLLIEKSTAIKCPWIGLQLANAKKIQQALGKPDALERFLDPKSCEQVRRTFAGQWGLEKDSKETEVVVREAITNPHKYVLKPQMEGGGKNFYGDEIPEKLKALSPSEKAAHIIQQKLNPMVVKNYMLRPFQQSTLCDVVCELGIYGALLGSKLDTNNNKDFSIEFNLVEGHMLRTKLTDSPEAGIKSGGGVVDSPFLI